MPDKHVRTLIGLGPRPVGSPANQQAADYIRETFRAAGLDVEEQPYACTAWEQDLIRLEQEGEQLDAAANAFSLPCDATAPVIAAGTIPQLEAVSAREKMLLLYGDLVHAPLSAKSWFLKEERDDHEYVRRGESYFPSIRCAINMDGIGVMLAANSLTAISTPEAMEQAIRQVMAEFPGVQWVDPWPESNHSTFSFRGIPALALSSVGVRGLAHSTADTIDVVSAEKLEEVVALVERLVLSELTHRKRGGHEHTDISLS